LHTEPKAYEHPRRRINWVAWIALIIIILATFALYIRTLDKQSLWFDEGLSVFFAIRPLPKLIHTLIREDLHPPLYYLLLHFWITLAGKSELAVRMPSAFVALLMVPLTFAVVWEAWGQDRETPHARTIIGIAAAALVGSSPFLAFYAQETRMYSLAAALSLATTWVFLKATRIRNWRWWLMFSCLMAASLYTQYLSVFIIPAFWIYALLLDRKSLSRTILCTLLSALLYLPWAAPTYLQLKRLLQTPDYWVTTRIKPLQFLQAMWSTFLPSTIMQWALVVLALSAIVFIGMLLRNGFKLSSRAARSILVFMTFFIPLTLTYAVVTVAPKFATRYAIVSAAPFYICMTIVLYAILGSRSTSMRIIYSLLIALVIAVSLRSAMAIVEGREKSRDDTRGLAAYLTEHAQANDALLLVENAPYALQYYYRGAAPWYGLHVGQDFARAANVLNNILQTRPRRIWLVLWHHEFADPTDMIITELMRVGRETTDIKGSFSGYQLRAFDIQDYGQTIAAYPEPENQVGADFVPGLRLSGFDRIGHDDGQLHYVLYWQAQQRPEHNYSLTLRFQDVDGNEYLRKDQALCTPYFLPPVWPLHTPIRGRVDVELPADLPPLVYRVYLQVLDPDSQRNLDLIDANGSPLGQALLLEELYLHKTDLSTRASQAKTSLQADLGDGLELLGFDLPKAAYRQGDTMRLTLWWHSVDTPNTDHQLRLRLLDNKHSTVWEDKRAIVPGYPATHWQPGETNRVVYRVTLPPDLQEGDYNLQAGIEDRLISLTQLHISAREHRYDIPPIQQPLDVEFEYGIALLGYDLQAPVIQSGKTITVTLYWQANQQLESSYKVSVQMLSAGMQIMAQDDSIPAHWTRPTTAWLPGEVIIDEHTLTIRKEAKPGDYTLIVALYDELSLQRLHIEQGGRTRDYVTLATLRIVPQ